MWPMQTWHAALTPFGKQHSIVLDVGGWVLQGVTSSNIVVWWLPRKYAFFHCCLGETCSMEWIITALVLCELMHFSRRYAAKTPWHAFLTRRLPVVSRTGRTEYQLLLMKASDRGRNVKFLGNNFGCVLSKLSNMWQKLVSHFHPQWHWAVN